MLSSVVDFVKAVLAAAPQYKKYGSFVLGALLFVVNYNLVHGTAFVWASAVIAFLTSVGIIAPPNSPFVPFGVVRAQVKGSIPNPALAVDDATQAEVAKNLGLTKD